jgi:toxin YhaV
VPSRKRTGKASAKQPLVLDGWTFLAWPAFDARWVALIRAVAKQRAAQPDAAPASPEATVLAALVRIMRDRIARDPNASDLRLRPPLGAWRRVKFLGRLRLFYRFNSTHRLVILTWLNDENTLRKAGSTTDPYVVFSGMLARGEVPEDWDALEAGARRMTAPLPSGRGKWQSLDR